MPHENDTLIYSALCVKLLFIGKEITPKGWKKAGISGLLNVTIVLPPGDPSEHYMNVKLYPNQC